MLLYTMLYIVLAYLMLFAALTNSVCLNNASFFFLFKYFLCQGYELSGEIALKNNHYYYYFDRLFIILSPMDECFTFISLDLIQRECRNRKMVSNVSHEKTTFICMKNIICRDITYYGT